MRFIDLRAGAAVALGAAALLAWPGAAGAVGEEQADRFFASLGVGPLFPLSQDFNDSFDVSAGFGIEAGYIKGTSSGLAIAPVGTFRYWDLKLDAGAAGIFNDQTSYAVQFLAGAKVGYARKGLFAYGEGDFGINFVKYRLCIGAFCDSRDESDAMLRFGGGADFSVWTFLAVGGQAAWSIVFTDDADAYTSNTTAFEFLLYAKFLFPEGPLGR